MRYPDFIETWVRRVRWRRELARMDARLIRDIGLTQMDVWTESGKPFWRR